MSFYCRDILPSQGMTFSVLDEHPLGLTLDIIEAFFDEDKRSNIGFGAVLSLGYKIKSFITSFSIGLEMTGDDDFLFFLNDDELDFDLDHSFTTVNFGMIF